jgi:hypothetical protein
MINPSSVFRHELASVRKALINAIREGVPSDVVEGIDVYQRLLNRLLDRFDELERATGSRPAPQFLPFGLSGGEELAWLQTDYGDFINQSIRTGDSEVVTAVVHGLAGVAATCVGHGDATAYEPFIRLIYRVWTSRDVSGDGRYSEAARSAVINFLASQTRLAAASALQAESVEPRFFAAIAKLYGELMKLAVDQRRTDDLQTLSVALQRSFGQSLAGVLRASRPSGGGLIEVASRFAAVATMGVDGWILYLTSPSRPEHLTPAEARDLRQALSPGRFGVWQALPLVTSFEWSGFLGWTMWELDDNQDGIGHGAVEANALTALVVEAVEREERPQINQLRMGTNGVLTLRGTVGELDGLLSRLAELENDERWAFLDLPPPGIAWLRDVLDSLKREASDQLADELIARPLEQDRIDAFVTSANEQWRSQEKIVDQFPVVRATDGDEGSDAPGPWLVYGQYVTISKDYFVETEVLADPAMLAFEFVRNLTQSEAIGVRQALLAALPSRDVQTAKLVDEVKAELTRMRARNLHPMIVLFAQFLVLDTLRDAGTEHPGGGIGVAGTIDGAEIFWETDVGGPICVLIDPATAGRVWWRPIIAELAEQAQRSPTVDVQPIDDAKAEELAATGGPRSDRATMDARTLRQFALVRVQELLRVEISSPDAGLVFRISP